MDNKTIKELRALAKERDLRGFWKLRKADLIALLNEDITPKRPPRSIRGRRAVRKATIVESAQDMDIFEDMEISKNRSTVRNKLNEWYDWLVNSVPTSVKDNVKSAYDGFKKKLMDLYKKATGTEEKGLQVQVENEAKEEFEEIDESRIEPQLHEHALKKAFKSYRIPGIPKTDIDSYIEIVKPKILKLVEEQLEEFGSQKIQITIWIKWKKEHIIDGKP